jgi:hypothetical protein
MTDQSTVAMPDVARCTCDSIGLSLTGDDAPEYLSALNAYLADFAAPVRGSDAPHSPCLCLRCGEPVAGLLGRFAWGMASGEGFCSECSWPARAHHYPKLPDGELIFDRCFERVLQYHPDNVGIRK